MVAANMDALSLAQDLVKDARAEGADASDVLVAFGTEFQVNVRKGDVEKLLDSGSKALGIRVFVGKRTASSYTSDFSAAALKALVRETVQMARSTGEDPWAGLPDEPFETESTELGLFDPSPGALEPAEKIEMARRAEAAALSASLEIRNSDGGHFSSSEGTLALANSLGFSGSYRTSAVSMSVVPVAERDGQKERDSWYTTGHGMKDLLSPEEVGRIAAERTLRRLGARKVKTAEVPVVFDPETAAELIGYLFSALTGYAVFRNATFLKDRLGEVVASPLVTLVDDGRRLGGLGSRPFDGEGLPTRRNVPIERGVLRGFLCDSYSARKIGARPTGSARRGVVGGPSVGASNLSLEAGELAPEAILASVPAGLYVTDLSGFGVNTVTGDFSQGATGHWIEKGRLVHPVHEVTIAGNLKEMLRDIDAVGNDLVFRTSVAAPTVRVRRMTVSGT